MTGHFNPQPCETHGCCPPGNEPPCCRVYSWLFLAQRAAIAFADCSAARGFPAGISGGSTAQSCAIKRRMYAEGVSPVESSRLCITPASVPGRNEIDLSGLSGISFFPFGPFPHLGCQSVIILASAFQ